MATFWKLLNGFLLPLGWVHDEAGATEANPPRFGLDDVSVVVQQLAHAGIQIRLTLPVGPPQFWLFDFGEQNGISPNIGMVAVENSCPFEGFIFGENNVGLDTRADATAISCRRCRGLQRRATGGRSARAARQASHALNVGLTLCFELARLLLRLQNLLAPGLEFELLFFLREFLFLFALLVQRQLVLLAFVLFPPLDVLSQLHWVGIAIVIYAIGRQAPEAGRPRRMAGWWRFRISPERAVVSLRVLSGLAIMAPALGEKLWNPRIAEAFLRQHPVFNFPHAFLGMSWMSDDLFTLAAGIFEFVIGALLISGFLTRVVIIAMWVPFNLTIPFLPPQELLWHLPFFGIMYFLLVHGADMAPDTDRVGVVATPPTYTHIGRAREDEH